MNYNFYEELISKASIVSFDIFDVLLSNIVPSTDDFFKLIESDFNNLIGFDILGFEVLRKEAEERVNQLKHNSSSDVNISLEDVYTELFRAASLDAKLIKRASEIELKRKKQCFSINNQGKKLYQTALKYKKEIILISNSHFSESFVHSLLTRYGYDEFSKICFFNNGYSSEAYINIFSTFKNDSTCYDIKSPIIFFSNDSAIEQHFGKSLGVKLVSIPDSIELFRNDYTFGEGVYGKLHDDCAKPSENLIVQTMVDKLFETSIYHSFQACQMTPFLFGYSVMGPLLTGFATWLNKQVALLGIQKLLFLSRDGEIMLKVFDQVNLDQAVQSEYCFSSRRIARLSSIYNWADIEYLLHEPIHSSTLQNYLDYRFCLNSKDIDVSSLKDNGFKSLNSAVSMKTDKQKLKKLLFHHKDIIFENCERQRNAYKEYLVKKIGSVNQKIAIVDIGYSGKMQRAISDLIDCEIHGFYFATSSLILENGIDADKCHAYIDPSDKHQTPSGDLGINKYRFIYETLICSAGDSFEGFDFEGMEKKFKFWSDSKADVRKRFIQSAHEGIVQFSADIVKRWPFDIFEFEIEGDKACCPLDFFLEYPDSKSIEIFYDIEFEDRFGPQISRVLIASKQNKNQRIVELWEEGVVAKKSIYKSGSTNNIILNCFHGTKILALNVEKKIFKAFLSQGKMEKYCQNRNRFFSESGNSLVQLYGKITY